MAIMEPTEVRLGCQGWTEADWQGSFYPANLKSADRLTSYAGAFDFVEIDSSFYSIPAAATLVKWRAATPEGFGFAAKLPQSVTHDPDPRTGMPRRPLEGERWRQELDRFVDTMELLGDRLLALNSSGSEDAFHDLIR